jgi:hypothetical protein
MITVVGDVRLSAKKWRFFLKAGLPDGFFSDQKSQFG